MTWLLPISKFISHLSPLAYSAKPPGLIQRAPPPPFLLNSLNTYPHPILSLAFAKFPVIHFMLFFLSVQHKSLNHHFYISPISVSAIISETGTNDLSLKWVAKIVSHNLCQNSDICSLTSTNYFSFPRDGITHICGLLPDIYQGQGEGLLRLNRPPGCSKEAQTYQRGWDPFVGPSGPLGSDSFWCPGPQSETGAEWNLATSYPNLSLLNRWGAEEIRHYFQHPA